MDWLEKLTANLAKGLREVSPDCREATRLQSNALDGRLSLRQRFGLRVHLMLCKWCRRYGKQIRFLCEAAHEHHEKIVEAAPQKLSPDARERIRGKLRNEK